MSGADFRFRMDRNDMNLPQVQASLVRPWMTGVMGFITQNTLHIQHTVIPWKYWHRHPYLPSFKASANISDHDLEMFSKTPPPYWRAEQPVAEIKILKSEHWTGSNTQRIILQVLVVVLSMPVIHFLKEYYGNIFTGDVDWANLVHRDVISTLSNTPTFVAKRDDAWKEQRISCIHRYLVQAGEFFTRGQMAIFMY